MSNQSKRRKKQLIAAQKAAHEAEKKAEVLSESSHQHVEPNGDQNRPQNITENVIQAGARRSDSRLRIEEHGNANKKWYKTADGWWSFLKRTAQIFGIAAVVIYYFQMRANRDQAVAAQDQFKEMQREFITDERAWVCHYRIDTGLEETNAHFIYVHIKNTGKTPALHLRTMQGFTMDETTIATNFIVNNQRDGILAPGAEGVSFFPTWKIVPDDLDDLKAGLKGYTFGKIEYDDIFGKHHRTRFCYEIWGADFKNFRPALKFNDCDDATNGPSN